MLSSLSRGGVYGECPACGAPVEAASGPCSACGVDLAVECRACGEAVETSRRCRTCGGTEYAVFPLE